MAMTQLRTRARYGHQKRRQSSAFLRISLWRIAAICLWPSKGTRLQLLYWPNLFTSTARRDREACSGGARPMLSLQVDWESMSNDFGAGWTCSRAKAWRFFASALDDIRRQI